MRQIYTSPRIENIDRVVTMLKQAGIDTHIGNVRNYAGRGHQRFSYSSREESSTWPQVWVVRSDDQVQARALLREAGLEPATRFSNDLAFERSAASGKPADSKIVGRIRLVLLITLAVSMVVAAIRMSGNG